MRAEILKFINQEEGGYSDLWGSAVPEIYAYIIFPMGNCLHLWQFPRIQALNDGREGGRNRELPCAILNEVILGRECSDFIWVVMVKALLHEVGKMEVRKTWGPEKRTIILSQRKCCMATSSDFDCCSMYHLLRTLYVSCTKEAFAYFTQINPKTPV